MHLWKPSSQTSSSSASTSYPPTASSVFDAEDEGVGEVDDGEGGAFLLSNAAPGGEGPGEDALDDRGKGKGKAREVGHPEADDKGVVPWAHRDIKPASVPFIPFDDAAARAALKD